ncbi:MAG: 7-cyano-7-deazaguanine synthase QueC [Acidobacteriota bacterium]|nr:7-cyano-7-deazaguanine synthase QueC [Acidobacteriota bacterium]
MAEKARAVVLVSGGMDSAVCAAIAARDFEPAALHVSYGQRTEAREAQAFTAICERLRIAKRMMVRDELLAKIGGSALTDPSIAVPDAEDVVAEIGSKIPVTYVPFRNAHLLAAAVSWAEVLGAKKVLIGAVEQDSSGYPDCRPEFYRAYNEVVRWGTKDGTESGGILIETPLIALRKAEIVRLGVELGAPLDLTWSCYRREDVGCGRCESCVLRRRAFAAAGVQDPIAYAQTVSQ